MDIDGIKLQITNILGSSNWPGKNTSGGSTGVKKAPGAARRDEVQSGQKVEKQSFSPEELEEIQGRINEALSHMNYGIKFFIDKPTGRIAAEIVDKETNKVIREIPEKEFLNLVAKIRQMTEIIFEDHV